MRLTEKELNALPLSGWIRLALDDLLQCEKDSRYRVDMNVWHVPNSHCKVCMAGSIMAKTLQMDCHEEFHPDETYFHSELEALDCIRIGDICGGLLTLGIEYEEFDLQERVTVTLYDKDRLGWRKDMFKIAHMLEKVGL